MKPEMIVIIGIFAGFALLEAWRSNLIHKPGQRRQDVTIELVSSLVLLLFTQPMILLVTNIGLTAVLPQYQDALANLPLLAAIPLFLIFDDMLQYWWHRASHRIPWLYNLHRAHHDSSYMSVRVVYRNGLFYYFLMPGIWCSGVLIWLGLGWVYAGYIVVKLTVICGAHSDVCWDKRLYEIKALSPFMWLLERTISTPSTHHGHHGKHGDDPATHYKGNYGNLLFFWDVLFGTAKITRQYPAAYGVEKLQPVRTSQLLLWPLISRDGSSVMQNPDTPSP